MRRRRRAALQFWIPNCMRYPSVLPRFVSAIWCLPLFSLVPLARLGPAAARARPLPPPSARVLKFFSPLPFLHPTLLPEHMSLAPAALWLQRNWQPASLQLAAGAARRRLPLVSVCLLQSEKANEVLCRH